MRQAGLTQGAFSRHFSSKEELLREALDEGFRQTPFMPPELSEKPIEALIRLYLSAGHRDDVQKGCLATTLTAEMARHPRRTRELFVAHLRENFAQVDAKLPGQGRGQERKRQAIAVFALLVGTLQMARVAKDAEVSDQILEAGIATAKILVAK